MTTLILTAFFQVWARQLGCQDVALLPSSEFVESPWLVRIESADACGHVLQQIESIYPNHGDTEAVSYLLDGGRAWDVPSIYVVIENLAPSTPKD